MGKQTVWQFPPKLRRTDDGIAFEETLMLVQDYQDFT